MTNHRTTTDGSANGRHDQQQPNLCHGYSLVDHNARELEIERLVNAREELDARITSRMLGSPDLAHSPAIDKAITLLPIQHRVELVCGLVERDCFKFPKLVASLLHVYQECSTAVAQADALAYRFVIAPSGTLLASIQRSAHSLEKLLVQINTLDPNIQAKLFTTTEDVEISS
jgi:hypothetical protein